MRKIIGIGETILDIIFRNNQPSHAVPGGSTFNTLISLGRLGVPATFISEIGKDTVGDIILDFMKKNGVSTENLDITTSFPKKDSTSCGLALKKTTLSYSGLISP